MDIISKIAAELELGRDQVENTVKLLDEGNTIPFIARYRKEMTGSLEDVKIRLLSERLDYLRNLQARKEEIIRLIGDQGKMTEELEKEINQADSLTKLDDLYRPFRPKRRTRATIAQEKGLQGLADLIYSQAINDREIEEKAKEYLNEEKEVFTVEEAIEGAKDIIAEIVSDDPYIRDRVRTYFYRYGTISSSLAGEENPTYQNYFDYSEAIRTIPNHRVLALNRGEREKALRLSIDIEGVDIAEIIISQLQIGQQGYDYLKEAVRDGYKRLLFPSIEREIRNNLKERAEEDAIEVFGLNLRPLLLEAPIKGKTVLAIDPGYRTGCKIAIVDPTGKLLSYGTIYPTEPRNEIEKSKKTISKMVDQYQVDIIAIGNGTASRETEALVADLLPELSRKVYYTIVNEAGASVYSASKLGVEEFPDLDVSIRGAVSIGRRLQDPLAELVKIEPRHIGVGQYQHDLNQTQLNESLENIVEDVVNQVGVDINTASGSLLSYVAGISKRLADNIIDKRLELGSFKNRKEILDVKGLGPKTFQQCAGFLRVPGGDNPLDNTGVHPESYPIAQALIEEDYKSLDREELADRLQVGLPTLEDIIRELERPGRDPREDMPEPILRSDLLRIEDLKEGMLVKGTVRNVVDFGAFVDIGVTEDGLVHISQLSDKFVKHPKEVVEVGDIVEVRIIEIDKEKNRIGLSMKNI